MQKYKALVILYLISVLSSSLASWMNIDVQLLYRVPFVDIRWIDVMILLLIIVYLKNLLNPSVLLKDNNLIIIICYIFIIFQIFQLVRSWEIIDRSFQISWFFSTLCFIIIIDLSTFKYDLKEIKKLLRSFSILGTIVLGLINYYLLFSFTSGHFVLQDSDRRIAIDVIGGKETVSAISLLPFVYISNLYFLNKSSSFWRKMIYIASLLGIYITLIIKFGRGDLATIALLTMIYFFVFKKGDLKVLKSITGFIIILLIGYMTFGTMLREKGYDPVDKLANLISFSSDINTPDWDKGRHIPREFAESIWEKNLLVGVGYVSLYHYGLDEDVSTAHNFIITSLFHNGILGTTIYLIILFIFFKNSVKLWNILKRENEPDNDIFKLLIITAFFWLIPFWNQEVLWEKYSLSMQFLILGLCTNIFFQKKLNS